MFPLPPIRTAELRGLLAAVVRWLDRITVENFNPVLYRPRGR